MPLTPKQHIVAVYSESDLKKAVAKFDTSIRALPEVRIVSMNVLSSHNEVGMGVAGYVSFDIVAVVEEV